MGFVTAPKRSKVQRENDLRFTASLYLRGKSQQDIANELSNSRPYTISQQQISVDLKAIYARWRQSSLVDFDEKKNKEIAKVDELERTYWQAWEDSRTEKQITSTKRTTGETVKDEASIRKERSVGNPAFLAGVQWCISKRCEILGLNAPTKMEIADWRKEATELGLDMMDVTREYEALMAALAEREHADVPAE